MKMNKGTLYVLSAPSGCGKGTVLGEVFKRIDNYYYSVSATTRAPRPGDVDGVNYYFVTKDRFKELIESDGMLEYAVFADNYYGTPKAKIMEHIENGTDVILEIETAGAMMVKAVYPEAVLVFMLPPSLQELRRRLEGRGTETKEYVDKRIAQASREITLAHNYDYVFVNDELEKAVDDFILIMKASKRLVKNNNKELIKGVLEKC